MAFQSIMVNEPPASLSQLLAVPQVLCQTQVCLLTVPASPAGSHSLDSTAPACLTGRTTAGQGHCSLAHLATQGAGQQGQVGGGVPLGRNLLCGGLRGELLCSFLGCCRCLAWKMLICHGSGFWKEDIIFQRNVKI